ncbi:hypothetical protein B0T10DRAFT_548179 [Thelonectria olida]|uniref:Uncharacterized protein n=1 Tax=Thelonectria olida TaxID=1576542 RepID=A0A9P9AQQ0_9HYPO|nr:hypothetical protein B0T10DRAFT_548179 [Thelonectria olida]
MQSTSAISTPKQLRSIRRRLLDKPAQLASAGPPTPQSPDSLYAALRSRSNPPVPRDHTTTENDNISPYPIRFLPPDSREKLRKRSLPPHLQYQPPKRLASQDSLLAEAEESTRKMSESVRKMLEPVRKMSEAAELFLGKTSNGKSATSKRPRADRSADVARSLAPVTEPRPPSQPSRDQRWKRFARNSRVPTTPASRPINDNVESLEKVARGAKLGEGDAGDRHKDDSHGAYRYVQNWGHGSLNSDGNLLRELPRKPPGLVQNSPSSNSQSTLLQQISYTISEDRTDLTKMRQKRWLALDEPNMATKKRHTATEKRHTATEKRDTATEKRPRLQESVQEWEWITMSL